MTRTASHVVAETRESAKWTGWPAGALCIAGNGSGDALIFLRSDAAFAPAVWFWNHETGETKEFAKDFAVLVPPQPSAGQRPRRR